MEKAKKTPVKEGRLTGRALFPIAFSLAEKIANDFGGVERSFAIQAGREIRVMVRPEEISDDAMVILARDIANRIENELEYPGQIKVQVIRESRAFEYAK